MNKHPQIVSQSNYGKCYINSAASQFQHVGRYATSTEMIIYFSDISLQNQIVDIIL
jgi:predicted oxidoreductase